MCGRTVLALDPNEIIYYMGGAEWLDQESYRPSYNVAPSHVQPVILNFKTGGEIKKRLNQNKSIVPENEIKKEDKNAQTLTEGLDCMKDLSRFIKIKSMKWGLKMGWSNKGSQFGSKIMPINIRDDSLTTNDKPMYRSLKNHQRCLVVAEGFYEWKRSNKVKGKSGTPYYSKLKNEKTPIMLIGALYNITTDNGKTEYSYALITTPANNPFNSIHNRMPFIFDPIYDQDKIKKWLSPIIPFNNNVTDFLHPLTESLNTYIVSNRVSNSKNDGPDLILKVEEPQEDNKSKKIFESFFSKSKRELSNPETELPIKKEKTLLNKVKQEDKEQLPTSENSSSNKENQRETLLSYFKANNEDGSTRESFQIKKKDHSASKSDDDFKAQKEEVNDDSTNIIKKEPDVIALK